MSAHNALPDNRSDPALIAELVRVEYDTARCTVCGGEIRHRWRDARDSWFHSTIPGSFWTLHAARATGVTPESGSISSRVAREKLQTDGDVSDQ